MTPAELTRFLVDMEFTELIEKEERRIAASLLTTHAVIDAAESEPKKCANDSDRSAHE